MKAKRILIYFLIITMVVFFTTNKSSINTIDDLAYVVALGFDVGNNGKFKLSFQIAIPSSSSSSKSSNSGQSSSSIVNTVECNTIESGISLVDSYISKKINLSHCKVIVFSEEIANNGISNYIYTLMNNIEIRPTCNVIVSKCDAEHFLTNSTPMLDQLSSRYYEIEVNSEKNTGYTETVKLRDFFSNLNDSFSEPYAILGSINSINNSSSSSISNEIYGLDDSDYAITEDSSSTNKSIENLVIAVFKGGKLVGELNEIESICHLILTNKLKSAIINVPSPFANSSYIALYVSSAKSQNSCKIINGTPYIKSTINLNTRVLSSTENSNYLTKDNIKQIQDYANSYIKAHIDEYLYKTSKEFNSDISGFGKYAVGSFKNWKNWQSYGWLDNYQNAFFNTKVNVHLKSSYLIMGT